MRSSRLETDPRGPHRQAESGVSLFFDATTAEGRWDGMPAARVMVSSMPPSAGVNRVADSERWRSAQRSQREYRSSR